MLDIILDNLQDQLDRYQHMYTEESEDRANKSAGSSAYLLGAVVASQHAVEMVERLKGVKAGGN